MPLWRGKNKFSYIENVGTAIGFGGLNNLMGGKTYFVNCNTGSDNYAGTNPNNPLLTLEAAEAKCVTAKHDFIFVQDFWTLTTEYPIVFDKSDMHVIGLGSGIRFDNGNDIATAESASAVQLEGCTDLELAGFNIGGNASYDALTVVGTTFRVHLHNCTFGNNYSCLDGIGEGAAGNMGKWEVHDCLFSYNAAGDGINCSMLSTRIHHNEFRQTADQRCIDMPAGQTWNTINDNQFYAKVGGDEVDGWAIYIAATCAQNMIFHNFATECGDVSGETAYKDLSSGALNTCLNGWCANYQGTELEDHVFA